MDKFYHALSLIADYAVKPLFQWQYIGEDELFKVGDWRYTKLMRPRVMIDSGSGIHVINETDIDKAKCLYQLLTNPSSNIGGNLQIPIDRWIKSKASGNLVDKMIDLGIALESLYVPAKVPGKSRKIVYNLKKNASRYLGTNKDNQEKLEKKFKVIYDCRCDAVHEGRLEDSVTIDNETIPVSELITKAQDLCRQSIMKILEDGEFPDWNDLILGEESL